MKVLIQRKTILLSVMILLGWLVGACFFSQPTPDNEQATPTPTVTPTATLVPSKTAISPTSTPTRVFPTEPALLPSFKPSQLGTVDTNVVYCHTNDGTELRMDVFYPGTDTGLWPVMMWVHGGGWHSGHKGSQSFFPELTEFGLLGVTIEYRLSPEYKFPAHIEDVKCALRFLRANAEHFHLDPDRILLIGGSAGAHLVSLAGTTADSGEFNVGQYRDYDASVQAVIALSAPTDLVNWGCENPDMVEAYYREVFGSDARCGETDPILVNASPITYVSEDDVPFLFVVGTADEIVPYQQSEMMNEALLAVGVSSEIILMEGADHNLQKPDDPNAEDIAWQAMIDFILTQLDLPAPDWYSD
ncbi:MAG: alpha/beta hydrolase [Anaerolineae bacterium]|jgi:acetyl esterase/lipase|nr:alpha/beta hydrolase [Anaerolineae bacterium]